MPEPIRRPLRITLAVMVLAWTGFGGFVFAANTAALVAHFGGAGYLLGFAALAFGVTSWATAFGLWRRLAWTHVVLEGWRVAFFLVAIAPTLLWWLAGRTMPAWQPPVVALIAFALATFIVNHLRRHLPAAA